MGRHASTRDGAFSPRMPLYAMAVAADAIIRACSVAAAVHEASEFCYAPRRLPTHLERCQDPGAKTQRSAPQHARSGQMPRKTR